MMGVATLAPWQNSSPTGGFISTERLFGEDLRPGMVVRVSRPHQPTWQGITAMETRLGVGLIVTVESGTRLWLFHMNALEVRQDCFLEPAEIKPCGCWDTSYLPHGGLWTCDRHQQERRDAFRAGAA